MASILIVDDEPQIVAFVSKGLKRAGHQIQTASNGQDALALVISGDYDLVLLDLGLPILDGKAVLREARGQGVNIPIIVLTAWFGDDVRRQALSLGATDFILKPFKFRDLLSRIDACLSE